MRISDWSSDGCSSDLPRTFHLHVADGSLDDKKQYASVVADLIADGTRVRLYLDRQQPRSQLVPGVVEEILRLFDSEIIPQPSGKIGRASCRESVCQYVYLSVVGVSYKKKKKKI